MSRSTEKFPAKHHSKKSLGQNFLVDNSVIAHIIDAVHPRADEIIIEIGPGRGALTERLVEKAGHLIAIEFDRDLISRLGARFSSHKNFRLVEGDALATDFCGFLEPNQQVRVVANLPYNVATAILQRLIEQRSCISEMVLMLQREVVERITAIPGSSERGFLSVLVEAYCEAENLFDVSPGAFRPVPKVWSSVVRLSLRQNVSERLKNPELLWAIVGVGFAHRRKTILNNLRQAPEKLGELLKRHGGAGIILCEAGVAPQRRAETLTLEEWSSIASVLE
ncbi:MAG: 16S rRNA (adenine(1518)-N(6)/adenine(1519)-N(6))-dimethyltransferase RsmA [Pyrinomonadaceae bacterium]